MPPNLARAGRRPRSQALAVDTSTFASSAGGGSGVATPVAAAIMSSSVGSDSTLFHDAMEQPGIGAARPRSVALEVTQLVGNGVESSRKSTDDEIGSVYTGYHDSGDDDVDGVPLAIIADAVDGGGGGGGDATVVAEPDDDDDADGDGYDSGESVYESKVVFAGRMCVDATPMCAAIDVNSGRQCVLPATTRVHK